MSYNTENKFIVNSLILFKSDLKDIMPRIKAINYDFFNSFPITSKKLEIEIEISVFTLINNFKIVEFHIPPKKYENLLNESNRNKILSKEL